MIAAEVLLILGLGLQSAPAQSAPFGEPATAAQAPSPHVVTADGLRRLLDTGHPDEVLRQIAELRKSPAPGDLSPAGLDRMEGLAFYALGQLRQAEAAFATALEADPQDTESAEMRGLTLVRLGRPAEAIPLLEGVRGKAVTAGSRKADPNYILALCYIDVRRYDDARRAFARQFGLEPDGAPAYLLAARMLLRREYLPVAQGFAEKAVALDPRLPLAHALLGEIALAGNHVDLAIAELQTERAADPLEPSVYDRLGDAYGRAGQYDKALASLQQAVLLEPNATGPYILLGKTLLKQADAVGAATYLERATRMDPQNFMAHSLLGQAYRLMGRSDAAGEQTAIAQKIQAASEPKLESLH